MVSWNLLLIISHLIHIHIIFWEFSLLGIPSIRYICFIWCSISCSKCLTSSDSSFPSPSVFADIFFFVIMKRKPYKCQRTRTEFLLFGESHILFTACCVKYSFSIAVSKEGYIWSDHSSNLLQYERKNTQNGFGNGASETIIIIIHVQCALKIIIIINVRTERTNWWFLGWTKEWNNERTFSNQQWENLHKCYITYQQVIERRKKKRWKSGVRHSNDKLNSSSWWFIISYEKWKQKPFFKMIR